MLLQEPMLTLDDLVIRGLIFDISGRACTGMSVFVTDDTEYYKRNKTINICSLYFIPIPNYIFSEEDNLHERSGSTNAQQSC